MGSDRRGAAGQLAVTLVAPAVALLLSHVPLPGLDLGVIERVLGDGPGVLDPAVMGILALELHPLISASWCVELLALALPRWRSWRLGGYPEREKLWARVKLLALVLTVGQALFFVRWVQHTSDVFPQFLGPLDLFRDDTLMFIARMLSLVGGVFLLAWLARLIDHHGAGNGISVLIAAFTLAPVGRPFVASVRHMLYNGERNLLAPALAVVAVAAITRLTSGRPLRAGRGRLDGDMLPAPASSVKPIAAAYAIVALPRSLAKLGLWAAPKALPSEIWTRRGLEAAFTAICCVLFAWAFNRPSAVAAALVREGGPKIDADRAADRPRARVRAAFAEALALSLVVCCGLLAIEWFCADAHIEVLLIGACIISSVVADVVGEIRFRYRHGALARLWPVHRLYELPPLLRALDAGGIPAFPRARHYRTLWNFFAPFAPVEILVPAGELDRADSVLRPLVASREERGIVPSA